LFSYIFPGRSILDKLPYVTHVIYMEDQLQQPTPNTGFRPGVKILPFEKILSEVQ
jgi:hypothetical protein